jgi:tRNA(Arg) A34 adenosine deaminase TadA
MARAEDMRRRAVDSGDQAYGTVIVKGDRIVGQAPSRVVVDGDPTAHAEMEAIRDASRRLKSADLSGCVMYSTAAPCAMCETAAHWAGIGGLRHGTASADLGPPRYRRC